MDKMQAPSGYLGINDVEGTGHAIPFPDVDPLKSFKDIPTLCDSGIARDPYSGGETVTCWKCISIIA